MSKREQFSLPLINSNRAKASKSVDGFDENNPESALKKLPLTKMTMVLKKIGAGDRKRQMFVPNE